MNRVHDLPADPFGVTSELLGQPGLPLATFPVQPVRGPRFLRVPPGDQLAQFIVPTGELDELGTSIQHPAGLPAQPRRVRSPQAEVFEQQIHRPAIAEDVDIRADHAVGEPTNGNDLLADSTRLGWVHRDSCSRPRLTLPARATGSVRREARALIVVDIAAIYAVA
ncbi:hypothetical protein [Nocardia anaemiae]|uniref:hypothetical protein n=1 Tax=Nocardia anaemiae TaxID=263910 RepID=UPI0014725B06|nr:hypothetical protein [Nocardia anaemiae]